MTNRTNPIEIPDRIELWPLERLKPYERNARTHSAEQVVKIAASIVEFGFTNPILVDGKDGIIAGHGRLMAAQRLKLPQVPVVVLDHLTDAQRRAYILADNRLALDAGWDADLLSQELAELQGMDFDLDLTGFSQEELAQYLDIDTTEPPGDPEEVPDVAKFPTTCPGDLWILGKHRLLCGSATALSDVKRLVADEQIDMMWTDPPYNVAYEGGTKEKLKIQNDSMSNEDFRKFLLDAYLSAYAVLKPGGAVYVAHADSEGENFRGAMRESGLLVKQCLVWVKSSMVLGRQDYQWKHEPILYGWKEGAAHTWLSDRKQTTVLEFAKPARNGEHPTMKPVELVEYCLRNHIGANASVLDLFGGSGTTLIAAENIGARAFLTELDPLYVDVIVRRWQDFTGQKAILEGDGWTFDEAVERRAPVGI